MQRELRALRRCGVALLALSIQAAFATDYYVNPNSWGDGNSGTSRLWPWKTLDKVNSFTFVPGDRVLFYKSGVWQGTLKLQSGVSYGSYPDDSTAPAPVIRASSYVGGLSWSLYQGKIYVADVRSVLQGGTDVEGVNFPAAVTQLIYNNARLQRARYPNLNGTVGSSGAGVFGLGQNRFLRIANGTPVHDGVTDQTMVIEAGALPAGLSASDLKGAQVMAKNWPWYLTRYDLKDVDAGQTTFTLSADPTWPGAKTFPLYAGNGYWLENKLWMLDKPGEWVFDQAAGKLYVWLPDGSNPASKALYASTRVHAIEGRGARAVAISDLVVGESMGDAVAINGATTSVSIRNMGVLRAGAMGIRVINNGSGSGTISNSTVTDSSATAIYLGEDSTHNINVVNNAVYNAGIGSFAWAAIWLGHASTATGNLIDNSSYIGMRVGKSNLVQDNLITRSCMEFDDCGGIYVRGQDYDGTAYGLAYPNDVGSRINANFVDGAPLSAAPDRLDGLPGVTAGTKTSGVNGIYLDDFTGTVTVSNNYVTGADVGVMLHYGRNNSVVNNTLVGNQRAQLYMQENKHGTLTDFVAECGSQPDCDANNYLRGNQVMGNVMASSLPNPVVSLTSDFDGVWDFASYAGNLYASYGTPAFAYAFPASATSLSYGQWTSQSGEVNSSLYATSQGVTPLAGASNMIANGTFEQGFTNWSDYHAISSVSASGCADGVACLSSQGNSSASVVDGRKVFIVNTTTPMAVVEGQQFVLTFDAKSSLAGDGAVTVLRSTQAPDLYADKTNTGHVTFGTGWQHFTTVLTVKSGGNTRLDFEFYAAGTVQVDNVKLVPAQVVTGHAEPVGFYNWGSTAKSFNCPVSDANACAHYADLRTGQAVGFPLSVPAKSSRVLVSQDPLWMDPDHDGVPGDGVAGGIDRCAGTADGASVDSAGCAFGQTPAP